jgi:polyphosphate kinase
MLHYPYQNFDFLIEFHREAAIDPKVVSIKMTLYRVARDSKVINALINASRNGKDVTVVVELQARFDEADNVYWAEKLQEEGVHVINGVPGLKVHAKLILIARVSHGKTLLYANISTGNFNESTGRRYTDESLFTADQHITNEVKGVFDFLGNTYRHISFKHLIVSPFDARRRLTKLINREIRAARKGFDAYIIIKVNNLEDPKILKKLVEAGRAGVQVRLMVRAMFTLVPDNNDNLEARAIVDRFREHSRVFVFGGGGNPEYYLSSGDWMERNFDHRVEVACPIYDPALQKEIKDILEILWADNVKARVLGAELTNQYVETSDQTKTRAQQAIYEYLDEKDQDKQTTPEPVRVAQ